LASGVELENGGGARAEECEWQPSRPRGLNSFRSPLSCFLLVAPSCGDMELADEEIVWQAWRPRPFLHPFSLVCLRMTMSGQARWFKAPSCVNVDNQRLVPPWWGLQPSRPWGLGCFPSSPSCVLLVYLGRLREYGGGLGPVVSTPRSCAVLS
jgi:hypothetical protein